MNSSVQQPFGLFRVCIYQFIESCRNFKKFDLELSFRTNKFVKITATY